MNENEKKLSEILKLYAKNCKIRNNDINVNQLLAEQTKQLNKMIDDLNLNNLSDDELEVFNMYMDLFESQSKDIKLEKKEVCGFNFVKIGEAYLCDEPLKAKFDGEELDNYKLALKLINNDLLKAEQSAYLVYVEDKLMYAGYYSGSFKTRWLREQNNNFYFWHSDNIDNQVNKLTKDNKSVSVWLSVNPYAKTKDNEMVNISKVLEDKIIIEKQPEWNKVGKDLATNKKNTKTVMEILNINE